MGEDSASDREDPCLVVSGSATKAAVTGGRYPAVARRRLLVTIERHGDRAKELAEAKAKSPGT